MEKEKPPVVFSEKPPKLEPFPEAEGKKKGPLPSFLLFILLAIFVSTLACFAVYTVVSMSSSVDKISAMKEPLVGKTIIPNNDESARRSPEIMNDVRPNFRFAVFVNGKPALSGGSGNIPNEMPTTADGFSTITNFLKKFTSTERNNDLSKETKEDRSQSDDNASLSETPKPKIIRTESWTIRRIPINEKENVFKTPTPNFPFNDIRSLFFPRRTSQEENIFSFPFGRKSSEEKTPIIIPHRSLSTSSEEDWSSPFRSPLKEFRSLINMLDNVDDSKMKIGSVNKDIIPRIQTPVIRIIPLSIKRFRILSTVKPNVNNIETEPKNEKPVLVKYKTSSEDSSEFLNKFLGRPTFKKSERLISIPNRDSSEKFNLSPLFQNWLDPFWPRLNIDLTPKSQNNSTQNEFMKSESKSMLAPKQVSAESSEPVTTERQEMSSTSKPIFSENSSNKKSSLEITPSPIKEENLKIVA